MYSTLVTTFALLTIVIGHDLTVGTDSKGKKIFDENRQANPAIWRQTQNLTINAADDEVISKIIVTDLRPEKNGEVNIIDGGQGQKSVTLELKSPTALRGYDFNIEVFSVPENSSKITPDQPYTSEKITNENTKSAGAEPNILDSQRPPRNVDNMEKVDYTSTITTLETEFTTTTSNYEAFSDCQYDSTETFVKAEKDDENKDNKPRFSRDTLQENANKNLKNSKSLVNFDPNGKINMSTVFDMHPPIIRNDESVTKNIDYSSESIRSSKITTNNTTSKNFDTEKRTERDTEHIDETDMFDESKKDQLTKSKPETIQNGDESQDINKYLSTVIPPNKQIQENTSNKITTMVTPNIKEMEDPTNDYTKIKNLADKVEGNVRDTSEDNTKNPSRDDKSATVFPFVLNKNIETRILPDENKDTSDDLKHNVQNQNEPLNTTNDMENTMMTQKNNSDMNYQNVESTTKKFVKKPVISIQ